MRRFPATGGAAISALAALLALLPATDAKADEMNGADELAELQQQVERLARQNAEMMQMIESLRREVRTARDEALTAQDRAEGRAPESAASAEASPVAPAGSSDALFSRPWGRANLQLLDVSLDVLTAAGSSTVGDARIELLQGGEHDPRQRGFTLQQVELGFKGAVDPYFTGEAYLIYFLDAEGESRFEIEEAYATSMVLPFALEEYGLQLELGQFFTEFGRMNPRHPHEWDWQDQPFVLTRFFGGDGIRQTGLRLGWLTPLPWFSELHLGMQNAKGETMVSFLADGELFEERPIGGRPLAGRKVNGLDDFVYLARWVNGFDVSDTWNGQIGASGLFGPNATGGDAHTAIAGADVVFKWRPLSTDRGWPFLVFQSEFLFRNYDASSFFDCVGEEEETECLDPVFVPSDTLQDWGLYAQLLWGFRRGWALGVRYEYGTGNGSNVGFALEDGEIASTLESRQSDPFRSDRQRISPLLVFQPSEFSRLRLQYNYDDAKFLQGNDAHSVWAGFEFLFGAHPAHSY